MATTGTSVRRRINANRRIDTTVGASTPADGYLTRIVKYVPTEFVTVFLAVNNFVGDATVGHSTPSGVGDKLTVNQYWIASGILLVANAIYLYFATRQKGKSPATTQIIISTILYAVFIYSLGGPFKEAGVSWYKDQYAAIALPVALFLAGFIEPHPIPVNLES